jgi:hypothetical protein
VTVSVLQKVTHLLRRLRGFICLVIGVPVNENTARRGHRHTWETGDPEL